MRKIYERGSARYKTRDIFYFVGFQGNFCPSKLKLIKSGIGSLFHFVESVSFHYTEVASQLWKGTNICPVKVPSCAILRDVVKNTPQILYLIY